MRGVLVSAGESQPTGCVPGAALHGVDDVLDHGPLLGLVEIEQVARVVDAVREELPPRSTQAWYLGMVIEGGDVLRDARPHAQPVEHLEGPPDAGSLPKSRWL